jgi:hypothetical protein
VLPLVTLKAGLIAAQRDLMQSVVKNRGGHSHILMTFPAGGSFIAGFVEVVAGRAYLLIGGGGRLQPVLMGQVIKINPVGIPITIDN